MRADKSHESSAQSTDSEQLGARSTESASTSSLGGSAAAAARVLAAWQDRAVSSADEAAAVAAVAAAAAAASTRPAVGEPSMLWPGTQSSGVLHHSATPTPRAPALVLPTRESSAPVVGSMHDPQQRADMGLLALLNSAAAYVAESADSHDAVLRDAARPLTGAYSAAGDLLPGAALTLSSINDNFNQASAAAAAAVSDDGRVSYSNAYDAQFSTAAYQDLAQALQHIAATSAGPEGGSLGPEAVAAAAAAAGVHPDLVASSGALAAEAKRKRRGGEATPAAKRRNSSTGETGRGNYINEIRRLARKWTDEETDNLLQGCSKYGVGAWKKILDDPNFKFNNRTSVDLKDRFRTIRAQECAQNPLPSKAGRKGNKGKVPDVVWPLPPGSQRLQGLHRVQRKPTRNYSADEDRRLLLGVLRHANHWTKIAADTDLHLGHRPGQSLRDRLRNAFPEVFELFGYIIPKKERADRERATTPVPQAARGRPPPASATKRKAPTGSKRLEGEIPDHIRTRILDILHSLNASLDPRPIPDDDAEDDEGDDDEANDDDIGEVASPHGLCMPPSRSASEATDEAAARAPRGARRPATGRVASTGSKGSAASRSPRLGLELGPGQAASDNGSRGRRRASTRGGRLPARQGADNAGGSGPRQDGRGGLGFDVDMAGGSGSGSGVHSAPAQGAAAAEQMAQQRSLLGDFFSPTAFLRQIGTMTPTDQLDALALEGRIGSGYSTPTQSSKRRHSIQANFNEALAAAAAAAAAMGRSGLAPGLGLFHAGIHGLDQAAVAAAMDAGGMPMNTAESIRRMTVAGPVGADPYLFPRLPDDEAAAAAVAAAQQSGTAAMSVSADHSAPMSVYAHEMEYASHRGQFRSAQRLLRANGVADDNSIGLSSASAGDASMDMEALTHIGEWFPGFGSGSLGWGGLAAGAAAATASSGAGAGGGASGDAMRLCSESIDPNMLDAGQGAAAAAATMGHDAGQTHVRRRSQFDWYGLTPSLAAALEAAGTAADASGLTPLSAVCAGAGPTVRRPSMPVYPTIGYGPSSDMLGIAGAPHPMTTAEPASAYATGGPDGSGIVVAAAAAAAAVAAALGDGSTGESMGIQTPNGQPHVMRSYSLGASMAITSSALAKVAALADVPQQAGPVAARPRVASAHRDRRRTMHVPPSLVEGVASSEFGDGAAPGMRPHHARCPYALPPRPTNAPRARRSTTVTSGAPHLPPVAQLFLPTVSEAVASPMASPMPGGPRHARTYSGTRLPQDVSSAGFDLAAAAAAVAAAAAAASAVGSAGPGSSASSEGTHMDMDIDPMATLGAAGAADPEMPFKASFWIGGGADDPPHLSIHDGAHGGLSHSESPTPTADRRSDSRPPRSAASTPGRREAIGI